MADVMKVDRGADVRFPPLRLVSLGFTVLGALLHLVAPIPFSGSWLVRSGGIAAVVAGVATAAWARNLFTRTGQNPKPWTPTPQLVFEGPYRFTRNPMYVSLTAIQIGLGLAVGVLWISLLAPVSLATIHVTAVRREERYLSEKFGREYDDYRACAATFEARG